MELARHDGYVVSDDPARLDRDAIFAFLKTSYWAAGVPREAVDGSIDGSLPFGLYAPGGALAGFARVVTDGVRFAWLADVFVLEPHRGRGLGVWLVETVLGRPEFAPISWKLATADAHSLYERFGFERIPGERMMERDAPG